MPCSSVWNVPSLARKIVERGVGKRTEGLDGVLACPLPSRRFVAGTVGFVDVSDLGNQRVVGVGVCEHGADGE